MNELLDRDPMENVMQHETTPNDNQTALPEPKFGEWLRGIYASESNPHRDGMYVRTIRLTGGLNPGVHYEVTDGNGKFWQYPAQSVERLATPPASQVQQEAVCVRCGDEPAGALCGGLTLAALIQFGKQAANPGQGATRWHMIELIGQMVPHLEALATHPAADALGAVQETGAVESLRGLAAVIRTYGTCAPSALDVVADRIEAALAQSPAVRVDDVLLRVSDEDLLWCKDTIAALQEAGGPTNKMRAVGLSRLIAALEAALGQGKAS